MMEFAVTISGGESKRLKTGGKYCPGDILVTAGGNANAAAKPVEPKDVNFYDYDGTLLYAYTLEELQALTVLPPLPNQEGLTCQGWNWTLGDLKAYAKPYDIMPYYVTNDGATWFDLVNDTDRNIAVTFRWKQYTNKTQPVLDFGDGSGTFATEAVTNGETVSCTHAYAPGTYRAKLSGYYDLGGTGNAISDIQETGSVLLRRVFLGETPAAVGNYAFRNSCQLETITITKNCITKSTQMFQYCTNLKALIINCKDTLSASTVTECNSMSVFSLSNGIKVQNALTKCRSLKRLCIPDTVTTVNGGYSDNAAVKYVNIPSSLTAISSNSFLRNYALRMLDIPEKVTSIGSSAFYDCMSLHTLRFHSATPPTVANANAFTGIPATCIVEVPEGSLAAYQTATNYGKVAAQMVGV